MDETDGPMAETDGIIERWSMRQSEWDLRLCLLPRICEISGRSIWLKYAYRGHRLIHGPGEPVTITHWLAKEEFVMARLRGDF